MRFFAVAFLAFAPTLSAADISSCAGTDNDLDRLACYDREAGRTPTSEASKAGSWNVQIDKSAFLDTTDVTLSVGAASPVSCSRFKPPEKTLLFIRCKEGVTSFFIATNCHLTDHQNYGSVDVRFDADPATSVQMTASTTNSALGLWMPHEAQPFIRQMFDKTKMLARFTPYSEVAVTSEFDIAGLRDAIKPLRESCDW